MPQLTRATLNALITAALRGNIDPTQRSPGDPVYVRLGRQRLLLRRANGALTRAGRLWGELGGNDREVRLLVDPNQEVRQRGRRHQVLVEGKWRDVRIGDRVTRVGRRYYDARGPDTYIISIPGRQKKESNNSEGAVRHVPSTAFMPPISLPEDTPEGRVDDLLKQKVVEELDRQGLEEGRWGRILLMDSAPIWFDPEGEWTFSKQTYLPERRTFQSVMDRPLRGAAVCLPSIVASWGLAKAALVETGRCVPFQLQEIYQLTTSEVQELLDAAWARLPEERRVVGNWELDGVTPAHLVEAAGLLRVSVYILHGGRVLHQFQPADRDHHLPQMVCQVSGNHAFFLVDAEAKAIACRRAHGHRAPPADARLVTHLDAAEELATKRPLFDPEDWKAGEVYDTRDPLEEVQRKLEARGLAVRARRVRCRVRGSKMRYLQLADKTTIRSIPGRRFADHVPWQGLSAADPHRRYYVLADGAQAVERELHEAGVVPDVTLSSATAVRTMRLPNREGTVIRVVPSEAHALEAFARNLLVSGVNVPYCGESAGVYLHKAVLAMGTQRRRRVPLGGDVCEACGCPAPEGDREVDHIVPLRDGGTNETSNLQTLCKGCHLRKTLAERCSPGEPDYLTSSFSPDVYRCFHESEKTPQLAFKCRESTNYDGLAIDVVRCRRNALYQNRRPIPLISPTDLPRPVAEGDDPDYVWVELSGSYDPLRYLGLYHGPGWMWIVKFQYGLERRLFSWKDAKWGLTATSHLPADFYRRALDTLEKAWPEELGQWKLAVNSMIGMLNTPSRSAYQADHVVLPEDSRFLGKRVEQSTFQVQGSAVHRIVFRTELRTLQSHRPIGQIPLDMEGVYLNRAVRIAQEVLGRNPRQVYHITGVVVDALYVEAPQKVLRDLERRVTREQYPDGSSVYRCEAKKLEREWRVAPAPTVEQDFRPVEDRPWRELSEADGSPEALAAGVVLERGEGLFLNGLAGTGKSHLMHRLKELLEAKGQEVVIVAFTNQVAQGHDGMTVHRFLRSRPQYSGWIILDEASQVPMGLFATLQKFSLLGARFILVGDFETQLGSAYNSWRGQKLPPLALRDTFALRSLCDFNRLTLTTCRRSSDGLFQCYSGLQALPREQALAQLLERFPGTEREADWDLCASHRERRWLSWTRHEALLGCHGPTRTLTIDNRPTPLFVGTRLLCRVTVPRAVSNGGIYEVRKLDPFTVVEAKKGGPAIEADPDWFVLGWALVFYGAQGKTLQGLVRVHVTRQVDVRQLIVGVSRATGMDQLEVVPSRAAMAS